MEIERITQDRLVEKLKARESKSMDELYDRFGGLVYSISSGVVRNQTTAEDLTQETFIRVWNNIHQFDSNAGSLVAWLSRIARNHAISYLRSLDCRILRATRGLAGLPDRYISTIENRLDELESQMLEEALLILPSHLRQIIELAYVQGLTHREIAVHTGNPLGTIKTWVRKSLQSLRNEMSPETLLRGPALSLQTSAIQPLASAFPEV